MQFTSQDQPAFCVQNNGHKVVILFHEKDRVSLSFGKEKDPAYKTGMVMLGKPTISALKYFLVTASSEGTRILNGDHAAFEAENKDVKLEDRPDWPYPTMDARKWAKAFQKANPHNTVPDDLLITWFANALMRGYDEQIERLFDDGDGIRIGDQEWENVRSLVAHQEKHLAAIAETIERMEWDKATEAVRQYRKEDGSEAVSYKARFVAEDEDDGSGPDGAS